MICALGTHSSHTNTHTHTHTQVLVGFWAPQVDVNSQFMPTAKTGSRLVERVAKDSAQSAPTCVLTTRVTHVGFVRISANITCGGSCHVVRGACCLITVCRVPCAGICDDMESLLQAGDKQHACTLIPCTRLLGLTKGGMTCNKSCAKQTLDI
jgi:hypothetical protein